MACARPMPALSSRIVQTVSGDTGDPAPITPISRRRITRFGTNLQTRGAALDATGPAMSYYANALQAQHQSGGQ